MKNSIKLFLYKEGTTILTPHHRPFSPVSDFEVTVTNIVEEADFILCKPPVYKSFITDKKMNKYLNKMVVYANDDYPNYLLGEKISTKFIGQPMNNSDTLTKMNASTVPLLMTDHEPIHLDKKFIEECRNQKKIYDYHFIGQVYGNRKKLMSLNLPNSIIKKTSAIYSLSPKEKNQKIKEFLLDLAKARFGFAPRGAGSNSFRLYECLMVGTIPIATDVISYPFTDKVDWDTFSIRGSLNGVEKLITQSQSIDHKEFRKKGMAFWDSYIKMDRLHDFLIKKLIK